MKQRSSLNEKEIFLKNFTGLFRCCQHFCFLLPFTPDHRTGDDNDENNNNDNNNKSVSSCQRRSFEGVYQTLQERKE